MGQNLFEPLGVGAGGFGLILRAAKLRGGHHLHGLCNFPRRFHRRDASSKVLQAGHVFLRSPGYAANRLANVSRMPLSFCSVSGVSCFEVRIASSTSLWSLRMIVRNSRSNSLTFATGIASRNPR